MRIFNYHTYQYTTFMCIYFQYTGTVIWTTSAMCMAYLRSMETIQACIAKLSYLSLKCTIHKHVPYIVYRTAIMALIKQVMLTLANYHSNTYTIIQYNYALTYTYIHIHTHINMHRHWYRWIDKWWWSWIFIASIRSIH
jgi:hypothetical protein